MKARRVLRVTPDSPVRPAHKGKLERQVLLARPVSQGQPENKVTLVQLVPKEILALRV